MTVNQVTAASIDSMQLYRMDQAKTAENDGGAGKVEGYQKNGDQVEISQEAKNLNQQRVEEKEALLNGQAQAADEMRNKSRAEEDQESEKLKKEEEMAKERYQSEMEGKQSVQITNIYTANNEMNSLGSSVDNIA